MSSFNPIIELCKNIIAGTRAALFMPVYLWSFKAGYLQVILLLIVSVILTCVHDYFDTAPQNQFNPYGLSYQAMLYFLFFFSLSLIAFLNKRLEELGKLIVLFLSIVPVVWLGAMCLLYIVSLQQTFSEEVSVKIVFFTYLAWYLSISFRLLKRFFYFSFLKSALYVSLYGLINFLPLYLLPGIPLWYAIPEPGKKTTIEKRIDIEETYYSQPDLLEQTIADVLPERPDAIDLYFIGFAGDAEEGVFMNEAKSAQKILQNRFDAFGRSILLINNPQTVSSFPLANRYNLEKAIEHTASLMNTEQDILFLFLTSHGSEEHELSVNFPRFQFRNLTPKMINHILDDAAIKWRVIVISACYSGGFIEHLSNANTLLITAASADKPSFGCGHDGQYTYFGEAYFGNSLKRTNSFIKAFELASKIIQSREINNGFSSSNPQISMGKDIESYLKEFEIQLRLQRSSNWAYTKDH